MSTTDQAKKPPLLTVTQVTARVKDQVEGSFTNLWVVGEITGFRPASSGHIYFNLKDKGALLRVVLWRSEALRLQFEPRDGLEVIVHGRMTVYPVRGDYQLTIDRMIPRGEGEQDLALRRLKEKLQALGYFARERKRPIPRWPRRLALVTSPTGAAIRDMLEILGRRWPLAEVLVCPVRVQGPGAAEDIARALQQVNRLSQVIPNVAPVNDPYAPLFQEPHPSINDGEANGVDVILLGRGGGSSEDLRAFNQEIVARAIFSSEIPIISAVGHEIDVTIADLVADCRALTPSEAAELATPNREELLQGLQALADRLNNLVWGRLELGRKRVLELSQRRVLRQPLERVRDQDRRLDDLQERFDRAVQQRLQHSGSSLQALAARLQALSPLNVLTRGYSLTRMETDKGLIRSVRQVRPGQRVEILLQDGKLRAGIDEVLHEG